MPKKYQSNCGEYWPRYDAVNEVYTTFFRSDLPARTTVGVSVIPMDALVQIDAVVSNGEGTPPGL